MQQPKEICWFDKGNTVQTSKLNFFLPFLWCNSNSMYMVMESWYPVNASPCSHHVLPVYFTFLMLSVLLLSWLLITLILMIDNCIKIETRNSTNKQCFVSYRITNNISVVHSFLLKLNYYSHYCWHLNADVKYSIAS